MFIWFVKIFTRKDKDSLGHSPEYVKHVVVKTKIDVAPKVAKFNIYLTCPFNLICTDPIRKLSNASSNLVALSTVAVSHYFDFICI